MGAAVSLVLVGAGITAWLLTGGGSSEARSSPASPTAPELSVMDNQGNRVPWQRPLRLAVRNGTLSGLDVSDDTGAPLPGQVSADRLTWQSAASLVPLTRYRISAQVAAAGNHISDHILNVEATDAAKHLQATLSPGDGATVGVGAPIVVSFNADVVPSARPSVEARLSVSTEPSVIGDWHWLSGREVHWRPPTYWQPHTNVLVSADLSRLDLGHELWGSGRRTAHFVIGDVHVSTADVASHTFTVTDKGQVVRVIPMSAGRDVYPTKGGVHIALEKAAVVTMDSATVGIPRDSPGGYYEKVLWDVRISNGGAFVHAAPWSARDQGHRNVSHGCVNISTADAQWFFGFSQRGDVVNVVNSPAPPVLSDPGMADWNIPWASWLAG